MYLAMYLSMYLSSYLSNLSIYLSIYRSIYLSIYLSILFYTCISIFGLQCVATVQVSVVFASTVYKDASLE